MRPWTGGTVLYTQTIRFTLSLTPFPPRGFVVGSVRPSEQSIGRQMPPRAVGPW